MPSVKGGGAVWGEKGGRECVCVSRRVHTLKCDSMKPLMYNHLARMPFQPVMAG
jgi:hypothetical protein